LAIELGLALDLDVFERVVVNEYFFENL
jgi:hypothetical protein